MGPAHLPLHGTGAAAPSAFEALIESLRVDLPGGRVDAAYMERLMRRAAAVPVFTDEALAERELVPAQALDVMADAAEQASGTQSAEHVQLRMLQLQAAQLHVQTFVHRESPFRASRAVVAWAAQQLRAGGDPDAVWSAGRFRLEEIEGLAEQSRWLEQAQWGLRALAMFHAWRSQAESGNAQMAEGLAQLQAQLPAGEPHATWMGWMATVREHFLEQFLRQGDQSDQEAAQEGAQSAADLYAGAVLDRHPNSLAGLLPLLALDRPAPADLLQLRINPVLDGFSQQAQAQGYSDYLLMQAVGELRALDAPGEQGLQIIDALDDLVERALALAPAEQHGALLAARESLVSSLQAVGAEPLSAEEFVARGDALVQALEQQLLAGAEPVEAVTRATTGLQALGLRAPDDDRCAQALLRWIPHITQLAKQAAPAAQHAVGRQVASVMQDLGQAMGHVLTSAEGADSELEATAAYARLQQLTDMAASPHATDLTNDDALLNQVLHSLRDQFARALDSFELAPPERAAKTFDEREAARLFKAMDDAQARSRYATQEAQLLEQLRLSLRPLAADLRRFEGRRRLMVIEPPFSTQMVARETDAVFCGGGAAAQALVAQAAARLGMGAPTHTVQADAVQTRWLQMRAAAVAVIDFSAYDRARCDPEHLPDAGPAEDAMLAACAEAAQAAFDTGWALLLGVPLVVLARQGQVLPFDIDVQAVRLRGDGQGDESADVQAVAAALVRVCFGVQRAGGGDGLAHTFAALQVLSASSPRAQAALEQVRERWPTDALALHHAGVVVLRALEVPRLLVQPAWPAPSLPQRQELFHVTSFRPWAQPLEQLLRSACGAAELHYRIGHEDLDPSILRAIWEALGQARFVVADITLLNPNAVLELAIAQAMGKPLLVVSQHACVSRWLPPLDKVRVHSYRTDTHGLAALRRLVRRFVGLGGE